MLVRIISALIGIIVGVTVLIFDNKILYASVLAIISAIGTWELIHAVKCNKHKLLTGFCVIFSAFVPFMVSMPVFIRFRAPVFLLYVVVLLSIMLFNHKTVTFENVATCGGAALVIPTSLSCIILLRFSPAIPDGYMPGVFMIVYALFCAWFGDSGAYFIGTFFGKHKLCPEISPKKTVEGLIGGIVTVGIVVTIQCLVYNLLLPSEVKMNYAVLIPIGMLASGVGVLGDLSASVIKRQYNVKDFGNLMPGHGGVLDRFDSVLFVAPFLFAVFSFVSPIMQ